MGFLEFHNVIFRGSIDFFDQEFHIKVDGKMTV